MTQSLDSCLISLPLDVVQQRLAGFCNVSFLGLDSSLFYDSRLTFSQERAADEETFLQSHLRVFPHLPNSNRLGLLWRRDLRQSSDALICKYIGIHVRVFRIYNTSVQDFLQCRIINGVISLISSCVYSAPSLEAIHARGQPLPHTALSSDANTSRTVYDWPERTL